MLCLPRHLRQAFTLLELVVVIAILGVLLGLLLPAIQRARDIGTRAQCSNNLRQIGLALHQYHDAYGSLPPGDAAEGGMSHISWHTFLLPYVEQQSLADRIQRFHYPPPLQAGELFGINQVIPVFGCPADGRTRAAQEVFSIQAGVTSYLGVQGTNRFRRDGVLYGNSHVRFADITDGTSNTLAVGERPPYPELGWGLWYTGTWGLHGADSGYGTAAVVLGVREPGALVPDALTCADTVYHFSPGSIANPCDGYHYWGLHFFGAHFLFADGAVRFLSYSDDAILPALATRSAGDIATLP